jgi:signal transduction histidine kinase
VRTLAHQLFPPELALLGLVGALRERAQTHPTLRIRVEAPELQPLPAEIETALYYIALEALTNIEKHARAQTCTIRLRPGGDGRRGGALLQLEISDDGVGLPASPSGGLGLLSMQARATEVGGTCSIAPRAGRGTTVTARVPCGTALES